MEKMTTQQILNMDITDFNKLDKSELSKVITTLGNTARSRIKRIRDAGFSETPAITKLRKSGGETFKIKNKNLNQLRSEFVRVRNFLNSETSTLTGYRKIIEDTNETLDENDREIFIQEKNFEKLWNAYEELGKIYPEVKNDEYKYKAIDMLNNKIESNNKLKRPSTIVSKILDEWDTWYVQHRKEVESKNDTLEPSKAFRR